MTKKLYVGNLSYSLTEQELHNVFSEVGEVASVTLITDRATGRPKGFGFVEMETEAAAEAAIQQLNGREVKQRAMRVNAAHPLRERTGGDNREGRGGGGPRGDRRGRPSPAGNRRDRE